MSQNLKRVYHVRYSIEPWDKPVESDDAGGRSVIDGIRKSRTNYGYTDQLFLVSIVKNELGAESILLLDSEGGTSPSRETLEKVREAINHHLEHHV